MSRLFGNLGVYVTDLFYEAFERFCIMSETTGDVRALKYIESKYGKEVAVEIWEKYCIGVEN